jgi:hypothetical protein
MAWLMASTEGTVSRRNISIVILDPSGNGDAWPQEWYGAPLNATGRRDGTPSELAVETLVLAHEGFH